MLGGAWFLCLLVSALWRGVKYVSALINGYSRNVLIRKHVRLQLFTSAEYRKFVDFAQMHFWQCLSP